MSTSHRHQLRLKPSLAKELESFAELHGLSVTSAIRLLLRLGLEAPGRPIDKGSESAGLATLTAAEHAVLMVASVLPEGQRRMRELAPQALIAAEERLQLFRETSHE